MQSNGFQIVGNLQTLYGGENGFPQAVLVAKTSLIENNPAFIRDFVDGVKASSAWLMTATGAEIVSAVSSHTSTDYQTTLKEPLKVETLLRCGVYFTQSKDCKAEIQTFLQDLMQIDAKVTIPNDAFYCMMDFNG